MTLRSDDPRDRPDFTAVVDRLYYIQDHLPKPRCSSQVTVRFNDLFIELG